MYGHTLTIETDGQLKFGAGGHSPLGRTNYDESGQTILQTIYRLSTVGTDGQFFG